MKWKPKSSVILLVLALAVGSRAAMLVDFVRSHPGALVMQGDSAAYWTMAGSISSGKLLSPEPYLSAPLYPWFLGAIRALGGGLLTVYVVQVLMHLMTAAILGYVVRRRFDSRTGLSASLIFLLMMEPAFYFSRILPTTLQLFMVTLVICAADFAARIRSLAAFALLASSLGVFALAYPTGLILLFLLPAWILWSEHQAARGSPDKGHVARLFDSAWEKAFITAVVGGITILPATLHNWAACGEFIPITAHGGITLRQGNAPLADGIYTPIPGISATRERMHADALALFERDTGSPGNYGEVDRHFRKQAFQYLASDTAQTIRLVARKFYWFLTGRHYSDIVYPTLEQTDGWIHFLLLAPVHTSWLMGLAALGIFLSIRRQDLRTWDALLLLLPMATVCLFWYSPRYRAPAIPVLILFTMQSIHWAMVGQRSRVYDHHSTPGKLRSILVCILLVAFMLTGPLNDVNGFDRREAYRPQYEHNRGQIFVSLGKFDLATRHFEESDRLAPDHPQVLAALADAYAQTNRLPDAVLTAKRLIQLAAETPQGWLVLGGLYLRESAWSSAAEAFRRVLEVAPQDMHGHLGMAMSLAALPGDQARAELHFREALQLSPGNPLVHCEYGRWLFQQGRMLEAENMLRPCVQLNPDRPETANMLAQLNAALGNSEGRITNLRTELAASPERPELYSQLAGEYFRRNDTGNALMTLRQGVDRAHNNSTLLLELAWLLATTPEVELPPSAELGDLRREAVTLAERAVSALTAAGPEAWDVLAAAYASAGRFAEAQTTARRAYNLAIQRGDEALAAAIGERLAQYEAGRPYGRE